MSKNSKLNRQLASLGLTEDDLTGEQLSKALKSCRRRGTGGYLESEELISKSFQKMAKKKKQ